MAHENIYKLNYDIQIIYVEIYVDLIQDNLSGYSHNGIIQDQLPGF